MAQSNLEDWQPVIGELVIAKFNVEFRRISMGLRKIPSCFCFRMVAGALGSPLNFHPSLIAYKLS